MRLNDGGEFVTDEMETIDLSTIACSRSFSLRPCNDHSLIEYMMAVRKNYHHRTSPRSQISVNLSTSGKIGLLKVETKGNTCFELFLMTEACVDEATIEYLARAIRDTAGTIRIVIPCNFRTIKLFRSGRFKKAAGRCFDLFLYDPAGTMIRLRFGQ